MIVKKMYIFLMYKKIKYICIWESMCARSLGGVIIRQLYIIEKDLTTIN